MEVKKKRIAVIGAGPCGMFSMISLLAEGNLDPVCFEKSENFGGTWRYREKSIDGQASIMPTTIINHSKEMGALSVLPPKQEYHNFMKHSELLTYIEDIFEHFDLEKYVQYNTEVVGVKKAEDFETSGRWLVTTKNLIDMVKKSDVFDGVAVCSGHINRPKFARYPGQDAFKGKIIHTHSVKGVSEFEGQNVLVVGMGCSGLDAAVEISSVAKQVYLSTRSGAYVLNRVGNDGYPFDFMLMRRCFVHFIDWLPIEISNWLINAFHLKSKFSMFKVKPKYGLLQKDPVINDSIFSKILSGSVIQTHDVKSFTETGVQFTDGDSVPVVDTVVMATGYTWGFPFLEDGILNSNDDKFELYKCMYPTHLPLGTLVFVGFLLPFGPGTPCGEMQARVAAKVFSGKLKLPSEEEMTEDVQVRYRKNVARYGPSEKLSQRVDVVQYVDDLASLIGAKPRLIRYMFTDFPLFLKLLFGPSLSYQYRLEGPDSWEGAREAIMTVEERIKWPLVKNGKTKQGFLESMLDFAASILPKLIIHV